MSILNELCKEIEHCRNCELAKNRTKVVPGEGPDNSDILFIGEAPGYHEDQQGRPFVGPAGQFLNQLLASINLRREQVYIANVIKCRPPSNRDPLPGEIQACSKWLDRQIQLINPKMIVTLGRYSMARYFQNESIGKIHGKSKNDGNVTYFAMYHPAAALHQSNLRKVLEEDIQKIPALLNKNNVITQQEPPSQQLNLF